MAKAMYNIVDGKTRKIKKQYAVVASNNLFDLDAWKNSITLTSNISFDGTTITITNYSSFPSGVSVEDNRNGYKIQVEPNTVYTMSWDETTVNAGDVNVYMYGDTDGSLVYTSAFNEKLTFTTPSYASYITIRLSTMSSKMVLSNIQIEKGSTATEYKPFTGPNGITRKIKKMYAVVGGLLKLIFGQGELSYKGKITPLSIPRRELTAATVGNYALFAGGGCPSESGLEGFYHSNAVDAYDLSLTRSSAPNLFTACKNQASTTVGNYALFAGGMSINGDSLSSVNVYDTSLTKRSVHALTWARYHLAATTANKKAFFMGGYCADSGVEQRITSVDIYNDNLTKYSVIHDGMNVEYSAATTMGDYAIFAGGLSNLGAMSDAMAYDANITKIVLDSLAVARYSLAATTVGNYALFAGGQTNNGTYHMTVDSYDTSLTRSQVSAGLANSVTNAAATTIGDYAIFAGGTQTVWSTSEGYTLAGSIRVTAYDRSLTRILPTYLSVGRGELAATTLGDYAIFAGGKPTAYGYLDTVEVYQV